jgi:hypothetical protein
VRIKNLVVFGMGLSLFTLGCGRDNVFGYGSNLSNNGGNIGNCSIAQYGCFDFSYTDMSSLNPMSKVRSRVQSLCARLNGSFSAGGTCSRVSTVGFCSISQNYDGATVDGIIVYGPSVARPLAKSDCEQAQGKFSTVAP